MNRSDPPVWKVPRMFDGETIFVLGGGPSLTPEVVELVRSAGRPTVAVNNAYLIAPWADVLFFMDTRWYRWHCDRIEFKTFRGIKVSLSQRDCIRDDPSVRMLQYHARTGLCMIPGRICEGANSGYGAINLAAQLGARRIVLCGYDMRAVDDRTHFFGDHPFTTPHEVFANVMLPNYPTMVPGLKQAGVEVLNCTPHSALRVFPMRDLSEVIHETNGVPHGTSRLGA